MADDAHEILQIFRKFERLQVRHTTRFPEIEFTRDYRRLRQLSERIGREAGRDGPSAFDVFHDNRYEQHWWSWSS